MSTHVDAKAGAQDKAEEQETQDENPFAGFVNDDTDEGDETEHEEQDLSDDAEEEEEDSEEEESDEDSDDEDSDDEPEEKPAKKPSRAEKRIKELTRAWRQEQRQRAETEARLAALEQRLTQPSQGTPQQEQQGSGPPSPEDFEYGELDSRYISALVDYQTDQRLTRFQQDIATQQHNEAVEAHRQQILAKWEQQMQKGAQKYEDFEEIVVEGIENNDWPCTAEMAEVIVDSDHAADITYHLAKNPEEATRIAMLPPLAQARAIGRLETRFVTPPKKKVPKAPPPVAKPRGAGGKFAASADSDDFAAFERAAMEKR